MPIYFCNPPPPPPPKYIKEPNNLKVCMHKEISFFKNVHKKWSVYSLNTCG